MPVINRNRFDVTSSSIKLGTVENYIWNSRVIQAFQKGSKEVINLPGSPMSIKLVNPDFALSVKAGDQMALEFAQKSLDGKSRPPRKFIVRTENDMHGTYEQFNFETEKMEDVVIPPPIMVFSVVEEVTE